ncbi:type III-A CRISPR-associated RAMP protein Csm5 [Clostridium sp. D2Q-14]|uniref:type III-A CRISPR-associated RAMP protein Csm5 n=1 Tax=Anaeromonas gelatinilytica TaxID=2683194 RepID=UPI00193C738D|nr:type III-A CRISPR-associated RAMP protein Csm5 [Anaeromonas gelatinilytica]MBS4534143.1 type III-A CRISPR-associated RAMP protein Csm5 [Anaeromonas gelatinilytica]
MRFKIQTLSPINIGSRDKLTSYSDYIYSDEKIYYVDHSKIDEFFMENDKNSSLMDEYIKYVNLGARTNIQNKYRLIDFFKNNNLDYRDFIHLELKTNDEINQEIKRTIVDSQSNPYIPGSSIKGSIRTALLYNHIEEDRYDYSKLKSRGYIGGDVFGAFGDDNLKFLYVSDSSSFLDNSLEVLKGYRYHLIKKKNANPIVSESIKENEESEISIQGKAIKNIHKKIPSKLDYLYGDENLEKLFNMINRFSLKCIEEEIKTFERSDSIVFSKLLNKYKNIKNEILNLQEDKEGFILRVGSGKTYYDNSIGHLIHKHELNKLGKFKGKIDQRFPKTRSIIYRNGDIEDVFGWVKITKKENR